MTQIEELIRRKFEISSRGGLYDVSDAAYPKRMLPGQIDNSLQLSAESIAYFLYTGHIPIGNEYVRLQDSTLANPFKRNNMVLENTDVSEMYIEKNDDDSNGSLPVGISISSKTGDYRIKKQKYNMSIDTTRKTYYEAKLVLDDFNKKVELKRLEMEKKSKPSQFQKIENNIYKRGNKYYVEFGIAGSKQVIHSGYDYDAAISARDIFLMEREAEKDEKAFDRLEQFKSDQYDKAIAAYKSKDFNLLYDVLSNMSYDMRDQLRHEF